MADTLDQRLLRVTIEVGGQLKTYDGLAVTASGTKVANATQNECEIKITNLDRATRDYLITETSPFNKHRVRKSVILEAGRVSTGLAVVYQGDIVSAEGSQPPDIVVTLKCATGNFSNGTVVARQHPATTPLKTIASQVAGDLGLSLIYEGPDKNISNYSFTGGALKQVDKLGMAGNVNAYVDDGRLVVKSADKALANTTRVLSVTTGMVGVPEFTEQGVKVKMLFDNQTRLGSGLQITSIANPAANGFYIVYKLGFELANRDTPWYYIAEAKRA